MKPHTLVRDGVTSASRYRFSLAPAVAALCFTICAPVTARGQDSTASPPRIGAQREAPDPAHPRTMKPATAPPATIDSPTPSRTEDSPNAVEHVVSESKRSSPPAPSDADSTPEDPAAVAAREDTDQSFHWRTAAEQALLFLGVQHGYALTQPKTRRDLSGPFFRDYVRSVASLGKWEDGGRFFTNYVAHPMQGALLGFVWVQNDPKGKAAAFGRSKSYWRSRAKALAWSAAWSTQFELGPVSQASIGNVGLHGKQTWVDIVVTPTVGTAWLVAEDALDRYLIRRIERKTDNRFVRIVARMIFNPTRSSANLLRFEKPWRRDGPPRAPAVPFTR